MNIDFAKCEFDQEERDAVNRVLSGNWLASGPECEAFEKEFAEYIGTNYAISVNSGSSANLLALTVLNLQPSSKILTAACGFPATLSPILHLGLQPVLVDYDLETHNPRTNIGQTLNYVDAVLFAHSLGNPIGFDCELWIEDCCEAVGSIYKGKKVGSRGLLGTYSFYPAHQMTAEGTGGMIVTNDERLARKCRSLRDWGKIWDWDTKLGNNITKYTENIDGIPYYKHYTYETVGYNMKLSETAAAFGRVQLKKLDFIRQRRLENYNYLYSKLEPLELFHLVKALPEAEPSWFGFPLTLRREGFRENLGDFLEANGIRTRPFFAGNITRHKPFRHLYQEGKFPIADKLMRDSLFIGIGQWLGTTELDYIAERITTWMASQSLS